jgi:hypothetical protein
MGLAIVTDPQPTDREVCSGNVGGGEADDEPDECYGDQQPRKRRPDGRRFVNPQNTLICGENRGDWI